MTKSYEERILLKGQVGLGAQGFSEDVEYCCIWLAHPNELLGLEETRTSRLLGECVYAQELQRFLSLALKANPVVTELLWTQNHEIIHPIGKRLLELRKNVLGSQAVLASFSGLAATKLKAWMAKPKEHREAAKLHEIFILMIQATKLLKGEDWLSLDKQERDLVWGITNFSDDRIIEAFNQHEIIANAAHGSTWMPDFGDVDLANRFLIDVRIDDICSLDGAF